jgi:hypothetical protein
MARVRVTFYLDSDLLKQADEAASMAALDRAAWIRTVVARELRAKGLGRRGVADA